jgi:hypothetical protein
MRTYIRLDVDETRVANLLQELERRGFKAESMNALIGRGAILVHKPLLARTKRFAKSVELAVTSWLIDSGVEAVRVRRGDVEYNLTRPRLFPHEKAAGASA